MKNCSSVHQRKKTDASCDDSAQRGAPGAQRLRDQRASHKEFKTLQSAAAYIGIANMEGTIRFTQLVQFKDQHGTIVKVYNVGDTVKYTAKDEQRGYWNTTMGGIWFFKAEEINV
jgi:hypothetical protein